MSIEIEVVDDVARACAAMMVGAASGGGSVVLTGGSTPGDAYREFVRAVRAVEVDLAETSFWFGDERCVPPDDEGSNYLMAKQAMLDPLEGSLGKVHRMRGELGPDEGAEDYERQLREAGVEQFELLLLGIGPDGHTASLFPDQPTLSERSRLVVGVQHAGFEPYVPRVSLTLSGLELGRQLVVLATGSSKASAVAAAFGPDAKPDPHVPSSLLATLGREVKVLLDADAAAQL